MRDAKGTPTQLRKKCAPDANCLEDEKLKTLSDPNGFAEETLLTDPQSRMEGTV